MLTKKYREEMIANVQSATQDMEADWDKRAEENALLYTSDVDNYTDYYFFGLQSAYDLLNPVYNKLNTDGIALEVGCGICRVLQHVANIFTGVCGTDVSQKILELGEAKYKQDHHVYFQHIDGKSLFGIKDGEWDFVYSMYVLDHIPKKEWVVSLVRDMFRITAPNGIIRIQLALHDTSTDEGTSWCGARWTEKEWKGFINYFKKDSQISHDIKPDPFNNDRDIKLKQNICWTTIIKL